MNQLHKDSNEDFIMKMFTKKWVKKKMLILNYEIWYLFNQYLKSLQFTIKIATIIFYLLFLIVSQKSLEYFFEKSLQYLLISIALKSLKYLAAPHDLPWKSSRFIYFVVSVAGDFLLDTSLALFSSNGNIFMLLIC